MNVELAKTLTKKLTGLTFLDSIGGLVQTIEYSIELGENKYNTVKIPVSADTNYKECESNSDALYALVPDSNKRSILYFEDNGSKYNHPSWESSLRLVCWFDKSQLNGENVTPSIISSIIKKYEQVWSDDVFNTLVVKVSGIPTRDKAIFSKYNYNEKSLQYLMDPFDFFAIDLKISFKINQKCTEDLTLKDKSCF
jgi:hypothetical protein